MSTVLITFNWPTIWRGLEFDKTRSLDFGGGQNPFALVHMSGKTLESGQHVCECKVASCRCEVNFW